MKSYKVDYELIGDDMQVVEIELDPGETEIFEADTINFMEEIAFNQKLGAVLV